VRYVDTEDVAVLFIALAVMVVGIVVIVVFTTMQKATEQDARMVCLGKYTQAQCEWALKVEK